jgi:hypothetical protein
MGLWLKCPHCLTANPLDLNSCAKCGASLTNLPAAKRVYIYDQDAPSAPKPAAAKPAAHKAEAAKPLAPEAATREAAPRKEASGEPAAKRAKGSKSRKKKQ